jgi:hypothetical protein
MPVPVASAIVRDLWETAEFTGFLAAARSVQLRPRVGGMIETMDLPEGGPAMAEARERHALATKVSSPS